MHCVGLHQGPILACYIKKMQLYSDVPFLRKLFVFFKHSFALAIWLHLKKKNKKRQTNKTKQLFSVDWHIQYSALKTNYST